MVHSSEIKREFEHYFFISIIYFGFSACTIGQPSSLYRMMPSGRHNTKDNVFFFFYMSLLTLVFQLDVTTTNNNPRTIFALLHLCQK